MAAEVGGCTAPWSAVLLCTSEPAVALLVLALSLESESEVLGVWTGLRT